ncbi:hypothetical protein ATN88_04840 [Enterovibrio coralii]|uniref:Uncharacterized protein n=1 Tax=Enterovibrio coralii TaxID=294935 RepID=A0A135IC92_9GAMM|nr:type VI secretion system-associated FHA domain protein TagH [Enterovibrio coralii]KXF83059.1 hypothetical protein ATN88_04840 [Enterovibrio coralii]
MAHETALKEANQTAFRLVLVVTNTRSLSPGLSASHAFDCDGGTIGSSASADWVLSDNSNAIAPYHAELVYRDHQMCLIDLSNACYINGSTMPVGAGNLAALNDRDTIEIGNYHLRVKFEEEHAHNEDVESRLESEFSASSSFLDTEHFEYVETGNLERGASIDDPLAALEALAFDSNPRSDAIINAEYLDASAEGLDNALNDSYSGKDAETFYDDGGSELSSAITYKPRINKESVDMDLNSIEKLERDVENDLRDRQVESPSSYYEESALYHRGNTTTSSTNPTNHLISGPLLKGLETSIGDGEDMQKMQAISEEIGASMKSAIEGLLQLHHQIAESRFGVMNKNFQPIEDNPLRLGLSYEDTMGVLFDGEKSVVHLSAPSAIAESLSNIRHHNDAVQTATAEALAQVLMAFSPAVLMRRFKATAEWKTLSLAHRALGHGICTTTTTTS